MTICDRIKKIMKMVDDEIVDMEVTDRPLRVEVFLDVHQKLEELESHIH